MGDGEDTKRSAEEILAEYVNGLGPGGEVDVESLCARFPEQAGELREHVADWRELLDDFDGGGASGEAADAHPERIGPYRILGVPGKVVWAPSSWRSRGHLSAAASR